MSGGRLPKRIMFGNLEGAVRRGQGGKEKKWTDCVQSDARAFGIAGDWKATAMEAGVWVETVTEGGRRFMPNDNFVASSGELPQRAPLTFVRANTSSTPQPGSAFICSNCNLGLTASALF